MSTMASLHTFTCVVLLTVTPLVYSLRKTGSADWWPKEVKQTQIDFEDTSKTWWPPVYGYQVTGRASVIKSPWEAPISTAVLGEGKTMIGPGFVDYWRGSTFNVAYGNTMNAFECVKPASPTFNVVSKALLEKLPLTADTDQVEIVMLNMLELKHTIDSGVSQLEIEMGVGRSRENPNGKYFRWPATIGYTFYAQINMNVSAETAATLFLNADGSKREDGGVTAVTIFTAATYGWDKHFDLLEYRVLLAEPAEVDVVSASDHHGLTVMTFNVWNTNPPPWLMKSKEARMDRYDLRMDLLCDTIKSQAPAIVAFQEVRYDQGLGGADNHCQMTHLSKRLPNYYYSFTPAMSYYKEKELRREDEGPAIASIFPIVQSDYLLLSRDVADRRDEHQRLCLHVVVDVPQWGLVDVFSVHLSLLEEARDKSVVELWNFITNKSISIGVTQILMGDMNAEPQEPAMEFLLGQRELDGIKTDFVDTWLAIHPEPTPRSEDDHEKDHMLTFPSDNPTKRIDFILVRGKGANDVRNTWIVGQHPLPDIGRDAEEDEDHLGMVHADSKLWASDHRAVVTKLGGEPRN
eukprot:m.174079 g.174079  ORF g.174079 m.174079 type:complete len:576 (+) comp31752_c0_seq2:923-2650(+)